MTVIEQTLVQQACELSGDKDEHHVIMRALQDLVDKLQFEKDKQDLYEHLEESMADVEAGRFVTEADMDDFIDSL
jgi:predicted transcriptional regulator